MTPRPFPAVEMTPAAPERQVDSLDEPGSARNADDNARSRPRERGSGPPGRRSRPADNGPAEFVEALDSASVPRTADTGQHPHFQVVSTTTGIAMLTETEASRLTIRIQLRLGTIADNTEQVLPLIEQARNGNAHEALGYLSWTAYVSDKFGGVLARLGKVERVPFVELLADQGMSTRAIGSVLGVSKDTVSRDLRAGVSSETPADPEDATEDVVEKNTTPKTTTVTGLDGKNYTATEPRKPKRRPLPDAYFTAVFDLEKVLARLKRLHDDDRFGEHRDALRSRYSGQVERAETLLCSINNDLGGYEKCRDCGNPIPVNSDFLATCTDCSTDGGAR